MDKIRANIDQRTMFIESRLCVRDTVPYRQVRQDHYHHQSHQRQLKDMCKVCIFLKIKRLSS